MNVDSRFSKRFVSKPFSGRSIDTPGAVDGAAVASGERGRRR